MSPSGKAPDFDSGIRRFKSCHPSHQAERYMHLSLSVYDPLAQLAEQLPFKQWVRSSNLRRVTKKGRYRMVSSLFCCRRFEKLNATRTSVAGDGLTEPNLYFRQGENAMNRPRVTKGRKYEPKHIVRNVFAFEVTITPEA